jgi:hypothetical protein
MRHPQSSGAFFLTHSPVDAAMHPASDSPSFHGPAAAAVRLLFVVKISMANENLKSKTEHSIRANHER